MKSVSLTAMLYPAARSFQVKAGDQVMVVAGVAVGIYTGNANMPMEAEAPSHRTPTKRDDHVPEGQAHPGWRSVIDTPKRKRKSKTNNSKAAIAARTELSDGVQRAVERCLAVIAKQPGITRPQLIEAASDGTKHNWSTRAAIVWLVGNNKVEVTGTGTRARKLFPLAVNVSAA